MDVCSSPISNNNENHNDAGFESDNISVTGSPKQNTDEENDKKSISPTSGAFTSLENRETTTRKTDLFSGFASQFQNHANFNPALTAQLFLQNPLLPQPSQWLYNQLYGNYNDFPWFRTSSRSIGISERDSNNINLVKRTITFIPHGNSNDSENQTTRQTPTPDEIEDSKINEMLGPMRNRTPKHVDVWRPY